MCIRCAIVDLLASALPKLSGTGDVSDFTQVYLTSLSIARTGERSDFTVSTRGDRPCPTWGQLAKPNLIQFTSPDLD